MPSYPKPAQATVLLLTFSALGYAGTSLALRRANAAQAPARQSIGKTPTDAASPAPSSAETKANTAPMAGKVYSEALAAQFRALLVRLGIDPSWAERLASDDAAAFPGFFKLMELLKDGTKGRLQELLFDRWAVVDPQGAATFLKTLGKPDDLNAFLGQWALIDFEAAAARAVELGGEFSRRTLREKARKDPAGFLVWLRTHPDINPLITFSSGSWENAEALVRLAELDPAQMLTWSKAVPEDQWAEGFPRQFAEHLAAKNPEQALEWAQSLKDKIMAQAALVGVATALAEKQPDRALAILAENPMEDPAALNRGMLHLFLKLQNANPDKVLETARLLGQGDIRNSIVSNLLNDLLIKNPKQAFAMADTIGLEASPQMTYGEARDVTGREEAKAVLDAAQEGGTISVFRHQKASTAISAWLRDDQDSLATYLKQDDRMNQPLLAAMKERLCEGILHTGMALNPALAEALGMGAEHAVLVRAEVDPAQAAMNLGTVVETEGRLKSVTAIATEWTGKDRGDAVEWAATLAQPAEQSAAWKIIAADWLKEDSRQASEWITTLPAGAPRDGAVAEMASQLSAEDPDLSWKWALTLTDPDLKSRTLNTTARDWLRTDPGAFQEALKDPALTPGERQALLEATQPAKAN